MLGICLGTIAVGVAARQVDRWHFSPARGTPAPRTRRDLTVLQRDRANDITPVILLAGHWVEIAGWWLVAVHTGPFGWIVTAAAMAVKMRHPQEVSHHAVHGVLTHSKPAVIC